METTGARCQHATTLLAPIRYPEALKVLDALRPESPDAALHQTHVVALYRLERWSEALQACGQALEQNPRPADAQGFRQRLITLAQYQEVGDLLDAANSVAQKLEGQA